MGGRLTDRLAPGLVGREACYPTARLTDRLAPDLPQDVLVRFLGIVADGVALQRALQEDLHRFSDGLLRPVEEAVEPREA